jgi:hypothetical protein
MSIIYINPYQFAAAYDPDAQSYITAVETADGQALEVGVKDAINDFVVGCKSDGIWSAIKASCILAGARTLDGALVPLVGGAPTNYNFVAGDYNRETGLKGNGSTKYLDSNRNNNADPQDNAHKSVFHVTPNSTSTSKASLGGGYASSGADNFFTRNSNGDSGARCRSSTFSFGYPLPASYSMQATSRSTSSNYQYRINSLSYSVSVASQSPFNGNVFIYGANDSGVARDICDARLAFYSIGEDLDLALLDTRVTTLINAIGAAIP